eukprot:CAMPEP_0185398082 /NCGR_PEP_ID=MMETSP1364-20130426/88141_1 /TAXON_ID=38817 /ORGANISM="Gephyrocapsa oceanica, Strain RCC1303" /LENGTH=99 /DNA_ID=CAMNT_0028000329 /DNA_START=130 /DNA_END=426 /DNA_ORIENTATION=-
MGVSGTARHHPWEGALNGAFHCRKFVMNQFLRPSVVVGSFDPWKITVKRFVNRDFLIATTVPSFVSTGVRGFSNLPPLTLLSFFLNFLYSGLLINSLCS